MKALLLPLFLLLSTACFGQKTYLGIDPVPALRVAPWVAKSPAAYVGSYHFGFSECESTLVLRVNHGGVTATKQYTDVSNAAKIHEVAQKFTHVRLVGNKFYSDQATGEFVTVKDGSTPVPGLKIYKSWSCSQPKATAEIGTRNAE